MTKNVFKLLIKIKFLKCNQQLNFIVNFLWPLLNSYKIIKAIDNAIKNSLYFYYTKSLTLRIRINTFKAE